MAGPQAVAGEFVDVEGERYYRIRNVDRMPPFSSACISDRDHWMFVASTGGLTAGRVSPDTALFPYLPVDRVYDSTLHTGCKTILRIDVQWRPVPLGAVQPGARWSLCRLRRNLYKSVVGNECLFEEINQTSILASATPGRLQ